MSGLFDDVPDPEPTHVVCRFSCGIASAVATKLALVEYPHAEIVRFRIDSEHPDSDRFATDCAKWFGREITNLTPHDRDHWSVIKRVRFLRGPHGAPCTRHLKIKLGDSHSQPGDLLIFGYTIEEESRVEKLRDSAPQLWFRCPLIEAGLTKQDCKRIIEAAGIELPAMYRLGYSNNNCIGCVKGGMGYWNRIRVDFPDVFARMSALETEIGEPILKHRSGPKKGERLPLAELDPSAGRFEEDQPGECGVLCQLALERVGLS